MIANIRQGIPYKRPTVGIGYIILPAQVDRDYYVKSCLNKEKLHILTLEGEFIKNCNITRNILQEIVFPEKEGQRGSAVVFVVERVKNAPIIVGILNNSDSDLLSENEFRLSRKTKDAFVGISGKGNSGELFINVESLTDSGGNIFIDVNNKSKSSKVYLKVAGEITIEVDGNTTLNTTGKIQIDSDTEIDLGTKNLEAAVLGNKMKTFLNDLITEIGNITTTTAIGVQPILNKVQILAFKNRTQEFWSQLNKLE